MTYRDEAETQRILGEHDAAEVKKIAEKYGVREDILKAWGGETLADKERFAKVIAQNTEAYLNKLAEGAIAQVEEGKAERDKELFPEPLTATMAEVEAMTSEQYASFRERGGTIRGPEPTPEEIEAERVRDEAQAKENERLERLSMAQYAKEVADKEKAKKAEVLSHG